MLPAKSKKQRNSSKNAKRAKAGTAIPDWYEPNDKGLRFLPGVLAKTMSEEQQVFYSAEQHFSYRGGVYGLVTFCFKDGHTESREYGEKKKGIPHTEEYKRYMSQVTKERWTPEAREEMSKRVKELRKERGKTWQKEK